MGKWVGGRTRHWLEDGKGKCECGYWSRHEADEVPEDYPLAQVFGPCLPPEPPNRPEPSKNLDLSTDAPVCTNAQGGKQSHLPVRMDLLPPKALLHVAGILHHGAAKYGENNWHKITTKEHLNHALTHIAAFLDGNTQDDHLGHACCRLQMALEIALREEEAKKA